MESIPYIDEIRKTYSLCACFTILFVIIYFCYVVELCLEVETMANLCEVCGKSTSSGMNVSHSHIRTRKTWKPNIQRVRAVVDGATKKVNVCTRCLRSNQITRA